MKIQHIARTGKIYYLHAVPGKPGKPKHYFTTKADGPLAESLPTGFEVYENVGGQVFLRRKTPQLFTDKEITLVRQALNRHAEEWRYKIEVKKNAAVIYEASDHTEMLESIALPWMSKATITQSVIQSATYTAVMRFVLNDQEERLFLAERFCFRGLVDDWIDVGGAPLPLPILISKFIKHLGKESLFELY